MMTAIDLHIGVTYIKCRKQQHSRASAEAEAATAAAEVTKWIKQESPTAFNNKQNSKTPSSHSKQETNQSTHDIGYCKVHPLHSQAQSRGVRTFHA